MTDTQTIHLLGEDDLAVCPHDGARTTFVDYYRDHGEIIGTVEDCPLCRRRFTFEFDIDPYQEDEADAFTLTHSTGYEQADTTGDMFGFTVEDAMRAKATTQPRHKPDSATGDMFGGAL